ncbi:malectin domain-containing carbohydrate-binding protein [Marinagarivorans algicola]|uniref:malectin domain-containing carbohydrate-binding protein n=1 Tax=Marinagarivorans algicola TaxID=1513270 RepID=UPI00373585A2
MCGPIKIKLFEWLVYLGVMILLSACIGQPNGNSSLPETSSSNTTASSADSSDQNINSSRESSSASSVVQSSSIDRVSSSSARSSHQSSIVSSSSRSSSVPEVIHAINAGGKAFVAVDGTAFKADQFYFGGTVSTTQDTIANTFDDMLFQSARWGKYRYALPVAKGVYKVVLYLNEDFHTQPGARIMSIMAEGLPVIRQMDLYAAAGHDTALVVEQDGVGVNDGYLDLTLDASVNNAIISGVVVIASNAEAIEPPQSSSSATNSSSASTSSVSPGMTTAQKNGLWNTASTWSNGLPNATKRAIIPQNRTVTIRGGHLKAKGVVVQGVLDVDESAKTNTSLSTDWVHVNSKGTFKIGSQSNPYDESKFTLTLTGSDPLANWEIETAKGFAQVNENNGFIMAVGGGSLQFFGQNKLTYTRLAATAPAGISDIYVRNIVERNYDGEYSAASDGLLNWAVGDQIVIASSSTDYSHEEVRTIVAVMDLGNTNTQLTLNKPLEHRHFGEIETYGEGENKRTIDMRAEVAILNRNVKIQGLASQDTDIHFGDRARFNAGMSQGVGGHIMVMGSAGPITLDSVQLHRMGQSGRLGRYPMHWHVAGNRKGDKLRGVSITNSNNRGVTVHGTHNLLIQDVVLHDIHGHGFFMEDAVETGNTYLSNIAFGIHKVGRSEAVGDSEPDLEDPFIVDTHDHVGQNPTRFLSSAAYWMTNPDNTWVGNISAGSEGTGFWFLFPRFPIGLAADNPQYTNIKPDKVDLKVFNYNSTHSSPIGLNVDRGSDIEGEVGAVLLPNFNGNEYNPEGKEPQFSNFTGYKHTVALYHRGKVGNFFNSRFADNFSSTFITFTQRITNALYVGHSRGNSDPNQIVTGHTFYDGANTLEGTHFAGFTAENAHMFRTAAIAGRHTHFVMSRSSYENDGSADNMSFINETGGSFYEPLGKSAPSVIYDKDGSLTRHVGGKAGSTVIPNHPYYYNRRDIKPEGWNARLSDDRYALMRMANVGGSKTTFSVTTPDGDVAKDNPGSGEFAGSNALVKINDGQYTVKFPDGLESISGGFDIQFYIRTGPTGGSTMVKFEGIGNQFKVNNRPKIKTLNNLRNATQTSFAQVGNDLYVKFFSSTGKYGQYVKTEFRKK